MKKKLLSLVLAITIVCCFVSNAYATTSDSSERPPEYPTSGIASPDPNVATGIYDFKDSGSKKYGLICSFQLIMNRNLTTKRISTTMKTVATDFMAEIGFINVAIQQYNNGQWRDYIRFNRIRYDDYIYSYSYTTPPVAQGYYYRVVLTHYAKEDTWFFPGTEEIYNESRFLYMS